MVCYIALGDFTIYEGGQLHWIFLPTILFFLFILEMLQEILRSLEKKGGKALIVLIAHSQKFLLGSIYLHKAQVMYYAGHIYSNVFIPCAYALREMLRY